MPADRRFPPPWSIEELETCVVVIDSAGQKLAYVYFEKEPRRRAAAKSKVMRPELVDCPPMTLRLHEEQQVF
jgi:hypothetical protein